MQPQNFTETVKAISEARLSTYKRFFEPANDDELYGIYCWNEVVSRNFFSLVTFIEIAKRNAFHREITREIKNGEWYESLALNYKSNKQVEEITHRRLRGKLIRRENLTPSDIVAKLSYGFWRHLLDVKKYKAADGNFQPLMWNMILERMLPCHPATSSTYWRKTKNKDALFSRMDLIGDMRNRVAHLEPIWKLGPLLAEGRGDKRTIIKDTPRDATEALSRLRLIHDRGGELLYWISKDRHNDYLRTHSYKEFMWLTSPKGFDAYRNLSAVEEMPTEIFLSNFEQVAIGNSVIRVISDDSDLGIFYPI